MPCLFVLWPWPIAEAPHLGFVDGVSGAVKLCIKSSIDGVPLRRELLSCPVNGHRVLGISDGAKVLRLAGKIVRHAHVGRLSLWRLR
jgi:hypothetical protein